MPDLDQDDPNDTYDVHNVESMDEDPPRCRVCDKPIRVAELCADCAVGNDPFPEMADR